MEEKPSEVRDAELNLKITRIQNIFDVISLQSSENYSGNIVAFVGPTKAGKSTLINYIMQNPLQAVQDLETEDVAIDSDCPGFGPAIGMIGESETSIPKAYSTVPGTDWVMWDFPGLGDNKGTEQEIANAAAYEKILRQPESVRFVLVVPINMLNDDNPMQFFKLLNDIGSICPDYSNSLCMVATKTTKGNIESRLRKVMRSNFLHADDETRKIVSNGKLIIQELLTMNRCADFRAPEMGKGVKTVPLVSTDLAGILDVLKETKGSKVSSFPLVISELAKYEILVLYTSFYRRVKEEVERVCAAFTAFVNIKTKDSIGALDKDNEPISASIKLEIFKQTRNKILYVKDHSKNIQGFLTIVKGFGFQVSYLSLIMKKYIFIEKIRNMYKTAETNDGKGEEEFYTKLILNVNQAAQMYSDLISSSEAASEEEKRHERELREVQDRERIRLQEYLDELEKENESVLVKGAKLVTKYVTTPIYENVFEPVVIAADRYCKIQ